MIRKVSFFKAKPNSFDGMWLSVSKVDTFKRCKAKYRYCYIEQLPRMEWEHLLFGKFVHGVLEKFHSVLMGGTDEKWNEVMTECYKSVLSKYAGKLSSKSVSEGKDICKKYLLKMYADNRSGKLPNVVGVENSFYVNLDDQVLLNGFIDKEQIDPDGTFHVADYKTTKYKKYLKGDSLQLSTYAYVKFMENPNLDEIKASYILLRHNFEEINKRYEREVITDEVGDDFIGYAEQIDNEKLWRPSPTNLCSYCDYLDVCKAGKKFVDGRSFYSSGNQKVTFGESDW